MLTVLGALQQDRFQLSDVRSVGDTDGDADSPFHVRPARLVDDLRPSDTGVGNGDFNVVSSEQPGAA